MVGCSCGESRHDREGDKGQDIDDIGFFGDVIGACPLCGSEVRRFRNFYGCDFSVVRKELERYLFERQRLMLQKERGSENVRLKNR